MLLAAVLTAGSMSKAATAEMFTGVPATVTFWPGVTVPALGGFWIASSSVVALSV